MISISRILTKSMMEAQNMMGPKMITLTKWLMEIIVATKRMVSSSAIKAMPTINKSAMVDKTIETSLLKSQILSVKA
jgi:hypothetical protein